MTSLSPQVSIVLPTYNRAEMLDKALATCLAQTFSDLEVVVVDDGSQDLTREVVQKWQLADTRVRLISQKNAGLPAALNAGFKASHGKYLTWTSDDNSYHADAIASMVTALQEDRNVDFVYCDYFLIDRNDAVIERVRLPEKGDLFAYNFIGACFMYRRKVYEKLGDYDVNLFLAEDYDYWLRVNKSFRIKHLGVAPYSYRLHPGSLTSTREFAAFRMSIRARLKNSFGFRHRIFIFGLAVIHLRRRYLPVRKFLRDLLKK